MKFASTAALRAAILCSAAFAVSACAYEGPRDRYYDGGGAYYSDDPCVHDHSYCGYPQYEGGIYVEGNWYNGRYRYRDSDHGREYWFNNGWHRADQTRNRDHGGDQDHHGNDGHNGDGDHHGDGDHSGDHDHNNDQNDN